MRINQVRETLSNPLVGSVNGKNFLYYLTGNGERGQARGKAKMKK